MLTDLGTRQMLKGDSEFRRCLVFSLFFNVFYGIFGVYIIPKWLIKVPGHVGILFR